jgi:hypothetical protein
MRRVNTRAKKVHSFFSLIVPESDSVELMARINTLKSVPAEERAFLQSAPDPSARKRRNTR